MNKFYVYAYIREADLTPYYIGKGTGRRAWDKNHSIAVPSNKNLIVMMETNLTEVGALALERRLIEWYGRKDIQTGILRNKTEGGDAPPRLVGKMHGMYGRNPIAWNKGKLCPKTSGENNGFFGKTHSEESRAKIKLISQATVKLKKTCPHCQKFVDVRNFSRWHGDSCKVNILTRILR